MYQFFNSYKETIYNNNIIVTKTTTLPYFSNTDLEEQICVEIMVTILWCGTFCIF